MATTPTTTTTTPPSTPVIHGPINIDYLNESWCELQYKSGCSSSGSISHLHHTVNPEVLEKLLHEAQKEVRTTFAPVPDNNKISSSSSSSSSTKSSNSNLINANTFNAQAEEASSSDSSTPPLLSMHTADLDSPFTSITPPLLAASNTECNHCLMHKRELESLLEKHHRQQRLILSLQKQQEQMLLSKSPKLLSTPPSISSSFVAVAAAAAAASNQSSTPSSSSSPSPSPAAVAAALRRQSSSSAGLSASNTGACVVTSPEQTDWMKCWSSRPQTEPPKEWNFIHPNSANLRYNNMNMLRKLDMNESKLLTKETIGKLIFTHMASFILGATLMFLILRKHLNLPSSKQLFCLNF